MYKLINNKNMSCPEKCTYNKYKSPNPKLISSPVIQRKNNPVTAKIAPIKVRMLVFLPITNRIKGTSTVYKPVKNPAFPASV